MCQTSQSQWLLLAASRKGKEREKSRAHKVVKPESITILSILPSDIKLKALYNLAPEEALKRCELPEFSSQCTEKFWQTYAENHKIRKHLPSWQSSVRVSSTIEHLNLLGPLYHSYFGLHPEEHGAIEIDREPDTEEEVQKLMELKNKYKAEFWMNNKQISVPPEDSTVTVVIPYKNVLGISKQTVPYSKVIIKYQKDTWSQKPGAWYNKPSRWWTSYMPYLKPYVLPYLNTRKYIHVDKPFVQVTVSAEKKGAPLTLDDILFATRALMLDDTRTVDSGYKILNETPTVLTLEPELDNWST